MASSKKTPHGNRETLADAVRRQQEKDVVRDLRASLAHDPDKTTRMKNLAELRARPRKPTHPLALYLKERGVSHEEALHALGLRRIELDHVLREWRRPHDAELIAKALGVGVDELFPTRSPTQAKVPPA